MASQTCESKAFILHTRPYRETSLLLTVLTASDGRVGLVAKGARRPRSALQGILQPFQPLCIQWGHKTGLSTLYQADLLHVMPLQTQLALVSGLYLNELLYRLLPEEERYPALFQAYYDTLQQLNSVQLEASLRYFEVQLLEMMGYGLDCTQDSQGNGIAEQAAYAYHPQQGFALVCQTPDAIEGAAIIALQTRNLVLPSHLLSVKRILKRALSVHLEGRRLHSRGLLGSHKA